jgi:hypothetical protein
VCVHVRVHVHVHVYVIYYLCKVKKVSSLVFSCFGVDEGNILDCTQSCFVLVIEGDEKARYLMMQVSIF